jgi:Uma2 family endonuclease
MGRITVRRGRRDALEMGCVTLPTSRRAEHIMAMPAEVTRRWTAREVRQLIADAPRITPRYELVEGELLVTPSPGREHQAVLATLHVALALYVEGAQLGRAYFSPSDVELQHEDVRQPDLFVVSREEDRRVAKEGMPWRHLLLAVEALSPSSARHDRVRKRPGYQRHVADYWIIDVDARIVERWRSGADRPEILSERLEWSPASPAAPFVLDLPEFFARALGEDNSDR